MSQRTRTITAWAVVDVTGKQWTVGLDRESIRSWARQYSNVKGSFIASCQPFSVVRLTGKVGKGRKR